MFVRFHISAHTHRSRLTPDIISRSSVSSSLRTKAILRYGVVHVCIFNGVAHALEGERNLLGSVALIFVRIGLGLGSGLGSGLERVALHLALVLLFLQLLDRENELVVYRACAQRPGKRIVGWHSPKRCSFKWLEHHRGCVCLYILDL